MKIVGIDASINSTGIVKLTLDSNFNATDVEFLSFTQVKKHGCKNILHYSKKNFATYMDQNLWTCSGAQDFCSDADYVAIEDYAYAATGKVFHIAEFSGVLKHNLHISGKKLRLYDPPTIKMFATKRGNADKIAMVDHFDDPLGLWQNKPSVNFLIDSSRPNSKYDSPRSDIVDAYFIVKLLQLELSLKSGIITLGSFSDKVVHNIFERVTKGNPTPLITRDFL